MSHPSSADLELYACRDLRGIAAWKLRLHMNSCGECTAKVERLRQFWESVEWSLDIPENVWKHLAEEMSANIHVGLSAAECVKPRPQPRWMPVPLFAALASLVAVAAAGTYLHQSGRMPATSMTPVLETSGAGIQARAGRDVLEFVNRSDRAPIRTVSAGGEVRSRYIDNASGDVTIVNVYAQ